MLRLAAVRKLNEKWARRVARPGVRDDDFLDELNDKFIYNTWDDGECAIVVCVPDCSFDYCSEGGGVMHASHTDFGV